VAQYEDQCGRPALLGDPYAPTPLIPHALKDRTEGTPARLNPQAQGPSGTYGTVYFGGRMVKAEVSSSILEPTELPQTEQV